MAVALDSVEDGLEPTSSTAAERNPLSLTVADETEEDEDDPPPVRRLRVLAMHGILRPNRPTLRRTLTARGQKLRAFSNAVEKAITNIDTLRRRGVSLLDERFPLVNTSTIIHKEDFEGDTGLLAKRLLQRMKAFNRQYRDSVLEKQIKLTLTKLSKPVVTVGVLGRIKCGKSTLLNALTHSELFPTDSCNPETSVVVNVCHSNAYHIGMCDDDDPGHGKGLKCPVLQNIMGVPIARGSFRIQRKLLEVNKQARDKKEKEQYFVIVTNVPALAQANRTVNEIVLQDTPGLGEAASQQGSTHIADLAETALLSCSAYVYILDCSKLRDQLDVAALELLREKDYEVYQDGRLLTVANQMDRTIQHRPGRMVNAWNIQQIQANVKSMMERDVKQEISERLIIPSVAYWAWCARTLDDDECIDDFKSWRKQYQRAFRITEDKSIKARQFIEQASGINEIEKWLGILSQFSEALLQKSRFANAVYCSNLSINACDSYEQEKKRKAEALVSELEVKRTMWNEAIRLIHEIEEHLVMFRSVLEAAYDSDTQEPKKRMLTIAKRMLNAFEEKCCLKCRSSSTVEEPDIREPLLEINEEENEDDSSSSDDDLWWDPVSISQTVSQSENQSQEHWPLPNRDASRYRVLDFKTDLERLICDLENRINDYLGTIRFVYIPQAIPLEEFGENKKLLYQYALNFLHSRPYKTGGDDHSEGHVVYEPPRPDEIQDILTNHDVSLSQLRERSEIKSLKLGWLGRMKVWFKKKFSRDKNIKENHVMRKGDVVAAIQYLRDKKCLEECSTYLEVNLKEEIVEVYHRTFSQHVHQILHEYDENCLSLMTSISSKKETEMRQTLEEWAETKQQLNYLINCHFVLQQQKDDVELDMVKSFVEGHRVDVDNDLSLSTYAV